MAIETKKKTIDGVEYAVTQFTARTANRIQHRLARVLVPLIGTGLGALKIKLEPGQDINLLAVLNGLDGDTLGMATMRALEGMGEEEYIDFIQLILASTEMDGTAAAPNPEVYDINFAGKTASIGKVISFVLEANNLVPFEVTDGIGALKEMFVDMKEKDYSDEPPAKSILAQKQDDSQSSSTKK